ncbi:hypothetical protein VB711_23920 [Cronbergia sp. UHCC 0137]|uniref:hypothetical protein n=1 Tax=Cronbergia sp. UHCC 0137 TaxID=3110239 RepID=UPI002B22111B|nr:hypothetical protein [Cronbergia sp. UHCC 0137]MEA5620863.1 hypothetical protein [Cronbergia sp. UHCC 0137]
MNELVSFWYFGLDMAMILVEPSLPSNFLAIWLFDRYYTTNIFLCVKTNLDVFPLAIAAIALKFVE